MTHTAAHAATSQAAHPAFAAVIFDIDGGVTDTADLHAAAWQNLFDQMLPTVLGLADVSSKFSRPPA